MIVPTYWAEKRLRHRDKKQVTVRRFGWSDISQDAAQAHADNRAREALERILSGDRSALTREPRVKYNGAEGVPIREEILSRHGETIITRNSYGAQCLNSPNVVFADLDFKEWVPPMMTLGSFLLVLVTGLLLRGNASSYLLLLIALLLCYPITYWIKSAFTRLTGGLERNAWRRIKRFSGNHPEWHLRLYRTPAGFRVLALHQVFDARAPEVLEFFKQLRSDPLYVKMCLRQNCFRARVSPKPWRIGISDHMKPRPGTWPIDASRMPERQRWTAQYELKAKGFASCRYVESLGSKTAHPAALAVQLLHDDLCQAVGNLPLA